MASSRPEIRFHINPHEADSWRGRERLAIFTRAAETCAAHGLPFRALPRPAGEMSRQQAAADGHLHLVENGRMEGEGWLNTGLAYLLGFWHLDPHGIQAESSARDAVFIPREVPLEPAQAFFRTLRRRFAKARLSRFNQPKALAGDLPEGCIALFLQGRAPYQAGHCALPMDQMITAVCAGAGGRPVVVKAHPKAVEDGAAAMARAAATGARFAVTEANVHDLLAAAAVTVSVNSAAAMEGFLHRKPALLFGQSDFASLSVRATGREDFAQALETALSGDWRFAKMLYWYYSRFTLDLTAADFDDRLFATFARVGFSRDRLGL